MCLEAIEKMRKKNEKNFNILAEQFVWPYSD